MNMTEKYFNSWMKELHNPVTTSPLVNDPCNGSGPYLVQGRNKGNITSPNYPSRYLLNTKCSWHIKVDYGMIIKLTINHLDIENDSQCR